MENLLEKTEGMTKEERLAYLRGRLDVEIDIANATLEKQKKRKKKTEKIKNILKIGYLLPVGIYNIVIWDSIRRHHILWK